jgi:transcription-repair coupling factor (superfamily II helicase)
MTAPRPRCVMAERLATLHALQAKPKGPQLLLTTVNAATQRTLTPFRIRQLVARLAPGERIAIDRLVACSRPTAMSAPTPSHDAGEFAVRGGIVDLFPSGREQPLRLDFFGDEIETSAPSTRRPAHHRPVDGFMLLPASEALLDEDSIKRFRGRYRERSAPPRPAIRSIRRSATAAASPAWSIGCRCSRSGWRPCSTICPTTRCGSATAACIGAPPSSASRRSPTITPIACRQSERPAATARSRPTRSI